MAGNDGGGVITYSMAGARLGYSILFTLIPLTILYGVTQEMGSRLAITTGKGLGDLVRERYGVKVALLIFILLLIGNFGSVLTNVSAVKTSAQLLGLHPTFLIIATILFAFFLIVKSSYEKSQRIFLTSIIFYFAYVFSAFKGNPHWGQAMESMIIPSPKMLSKDYIITSIAVIGTTITPWGQFFVQSYMKDKQVAEDRLGYAKIEAFTGAFVSNFFTFFIMVATAATLYVHGIALTSGEEAAMAIRPFAGELSGILFGVGLLNAAIIGMIIVSLSSAYAWTEFFGFSGTLDAPFEKSREFYTIFLFSLIVSALLVSTPWISLFQIVLYTQSLNAILLPVFFYFIIKFCNDAGLVGKYVNSRTYNYIAKASSVLIVIAATIAVVSAILGL
jgi:NRAMP (natural resistance-associated macrophage protein)-like metal ion transporter